MCDYGSDVGLLSFLDEWLVFEGERTRFSLASGEVALAEGDLAFSFDAPGGFRTVTIYPLDQKAFKPVWDRWQAAERRKESHAVLFPPCRPLPERSARPFAWGAQGGAVLGALIVAEMLGSEPFYWGSVAVILAVFIPGVVLLALYARFVERELDRLAHDLPPTRRPGILFSGDPRAYLRWRRAWRARRLGGFAAREGEDADLLRAGLNEGGGAGAGGVAGGEDVVHQEHAPTRHQG